jgi:acetate kinase
MNSLVLIPAKYGVSYARISIQTPLQGDNNPRLVHDLRGSSAGLTEVRAALSTNPLAPPIDVLTIWSMFGGPDFAAPVMANQANQDRLMRLRSQAPLSVAKTTGLIAEAHHAFPQTPIALAFETSFFVNLPTRETTYALPGDSGMSPRRWGYHGLYHEEATCQLIQTLATQGRPARMLSICLDRQPEIAAVLGRAPLLVTSGSTPVEGLPGECNCGEIDPAIALALAADPALGPEHANILLTQESGFAGMLGHPITLGEVLTSKRARVAKIRDHLLYRIRLAAGSSLAALEGLDGVVFSGRYAQHAESVATRLMPHLERTLDKPRGSLPWVTCETPLDAIVAEAGLSALLTSGRARSGSDDARAA